MKDYFLYIYRMINKLTIAEYLQRRRHSLDYKGTFDKVGHRGKYAQTPPFVVHHETQIPLPEVSTRTQVIIECETEFWWSGTVLNRDLLHILYADDTELWDNYQKLKLRRLVGKDKSRNNIICEPACCACLWMFNNGTLTVVARSLDLRVAGITDLYGIHEIAKRLNAKSYIWYVVCPHVYELNGIARRSNEITSI